MYVLAWFIVITMVLFAVLIAAGITAAVALLAGDRDDEQRQAAPGGSNPGVSKPASHAGLAAARGEHT